MTERFGETRRGKPLAQYVKALRATESALADFQALRQGFSPPNTVEQDRQPGRAHD
jgi:hypothetical protein